VKLQKLGRPTAKPIVVFEACRIKGVTLLRGLQVEAAKQLVIRVKCGEMSA